MILGFRLRFRFQGRWSSNNFRVRGGDCRALGGILTLMIYTGLKNITGFDYGYLKIISEVMKWVIFFFKNICPWACILLRYIDLEKTWSKK